MAAFTQSASRPVARRIRGFGSSTQYSLGVEEEFQLLRPDTFELNPVVDELMATLEPEHRPQVKHELMQSVVETATVVCANTGEAFDDLLRLRKLVADRAQRVGAVIASSGTTPVSCWEGQKVTDQKRYRDIVAKLQWVARRELIFGLHVHVGVDSADKCMYVYNAMRDELPLLLALSVNSPFWQGSPTGLQSSRIKIFDAFPRSGMPPALPGGWDEFEDLLARGARTGLVPDHTYVWWDLRPHPDFGTIEVRICDAQTRLRDTVAIAALVQALVAWHGDRFDRGVPLPEPTPAMFIGENRWSAARYGLDGEMLDFHSDEMVATRHLLARLLDRVEGHANRLGSEHFHLLGGMLDRTAASRQLQAWHAGGADTDGGVPAGRAVGAFLARETAGEL